VEQVRAQTSGVGIRRAEPDDADALTRISFAAKGYWGYPERWIEQWRDALTITPEFIRNNEVYAAVFEEEIGGFYALVGRGRELELEHLWVSPEHIGAGVGRALLDHAVRRAAALGATTLRIEADPNAEGFYRRMGARRVGENVYEIEGHRRELPLLILDVPSHRRAV
jgi:ribosomal protein S18 acetylase RimI-like enzyme